MYGANCVTHLVLLLATSHSCIVNPPFALCLILERYAHCCCCVQDCAICEERSSTDRARGGIDNKVETYGITFWVHGADISPLSYQHLLQERRIPYVIKAAVRLKGRGRRIGIAVECKC